MKISAKGEYAYRAVFELARHHLREPEAVVQLDQIAEHQKIPKKYLVQILLQLKRSGLVGTVRGVKGGYYLRKEPSQISLGEVLEQVDGAFVPLSCVDRGKGCAMDEVSCVFKPIFDEVRSTVRKMVYGISFEELCRRAEKPQERMYYI